MHVHIHVHVLVLVRVVCECMDLPEGLGCAWQWSRRAMAAGSLEAMPAESCLKACCVEELHAVGAGLRRKLGTLAARLEDEHGRISDGDRCFNWRRFAAPTSSSAGIFQNTDSLHDCLVGC